jgi:hypothetical protein
VKGNHADATGLVVGALARPRDLPALGPSRWDQLLCRARNARLLGRLSAELEVLGLLDSLPPQAAGQIRAEGAVAAENARMVRSAT